MADEKSIVKMMNKMIHKKTGASFLVVYVIYVSLVYTDSKKTGSCLLPQHTIFATFGRSIKMHICTHTGRFISVPLCSGQSELASICLFVQFNNQIYLFFFYLFKSSKTHTSAAPLLLEKGGEVKMKLQRFKTIY